MWRPASDWPLFILGVCCCTTYRAAGHHPLQGGQAGRRAAASLRRDMPGDAGGYCGYGVARRAIVRNGSADVDQSAGTVRTGEHGYSGSRTFSGGSYAVCAGGLNVQRALSKSNVQHDFALGVNVTEPQQGDSMKSNRIPDFNDNSFDGMLTWFSEMSFRGLLFHPDDPPNTIVKIVDGTPLFSKSEARKIRTIVENMFEQFGDRVYDAAYPIFMNAFGLRLDA